MNKKVLTLTLTGLVMLCVVVGLASKVARATPPRGLAQTRIAGPVVMGEMHVVNETPDHGVMIKTRGLSDAYVVQNRIAPGGDTGWHTHPGPVFVLVTAGTATVYEANGPTRTPSFYPAGTGFLDGVDDTHIVRNEGDTDLVLTAVFLVPHGAPPRIDEPQPLNYPF